MRVVIQRVKQAKVKINNRIVSKIGRGLLVLLAVHKDDEESITQKIAKKVLNLRVFSDDNNKMNLSVKNVAGEIMVVSQFTLYGDCNKGNRPSFIESAKPERAMPMYEKFVEYIRGQGVKCETGIFGAMMEVKLINDGPVTIILDL